MVEGRERTLYGGIALVIAQARDIDRHSIQGLDHTGPSVDTTQQRRAEKISAKRHQAPSIGAVSILINERAEFWKVVKFIDVVEVHHAERHGGWGRRVQRGARAHGEQP